MELVGRAPAVVGITLFMGGMFYKLALFPFHFWAPDVYQGASNETATYIATLPKFGVLVILMRLSALHPGSQVAQVLAVLSAVSMTYGNLAALVRLIKRIRGFRPWRMPATSWWAWWPVRLKAWTQPHSIPWLTSS